jgi:glycoprotein endo-alpha-1,2-mannosidase
LPRASSASAVPSVDAGSSPDSANPSSSSLASPAAQLPSADTRVTAFFYQWYGTQAYDGKWIHWNQLGHVPPDDIASSFYPQRGPYSSRDPAVIAQQMEELRAARVGVISVSWWGQGSIEDVALPALFSAAAVAGVKIAFHMEPYQGQTAASIVSDIRYLLARYGGSPALYRVSRPTSGDATTAARPVFYLFGSSKLPFADLRTAISELRGTADDAIILLHSPKAVSATRVGADGVYTYDAMSDPAALAALVGDCKSANLLCSPSVAPGFDNREAVSTGIVVVDRANGARYDSMWQAVLGATAEWVSITTFNEWHEGTQIEPAMDFSAAGRTYTGYEGAYATSAADAPNAYIERTAYWVGQFETAAG